MLLDGVSKIFDITMFGAISDGNTLCTKSFDKAISECEKEKGGIIYVPAGSFLTGGIYLKSNMTLYLGAGARLIFSNNKNDYPPLYTRWEGFEQLAYMPMIYG